MGEGRLLKGDLKLLLIVFGVMALILTVTIVLAQPAKVKSMWIEKEKGSGPWTIESGSRSEEEQQAALEESLKLDGPFIILRTTSEVSVKFSTSSGEQRSMNQSENIPNVAY